MTTEDSFKAMPELESRFKDRALLPYQERVLQERAELCDKIVKLQAFVALDNNSTIGVDEKVRLTMQLKVMKLYSDILLDRILAF